MVNRFPGSKAFDGRKQKPKNIHAKELTPNQGCYHRGDGRLHPATFYDLIWNQHEFETEAKEARNAQSPNPSVS